MSFWSEKVGNQFSSSLLIVLAIFLIVGCKVEDNTWIEKMIAEVGLAFEKADEAGLGNESRDAAMTKAVHQYFPVGMRKEDVFTLLREMKNRGFDITEYRYEGSREWPSGELRPYIDDATRRNLQRQYPPGAVEMVAIRKWRSLLVVEEFFSISITLPDDSHLIRRVSVNRSANFI